MTQAIYSDDKSGSRVATIPLGQQPLLDGSGTVDVRHAVAAGDWTTARKAGYWPIKAAPEPAAGLVVTGRDYVLVGDVYEERLTTEPAPEPPTPEEIAAAEALRLATPIVFDQPLQARIETPAADGHVYGLEVDADSGEVVPVQRESTRLTQAEYETARAARLAERATHRNRIAAIKTDLDQVETALDQIDVSAAGPLGTAIAATSGVNKTALQLVRTTLGDVKAALKNLRQASEKIRREIR